MARTHIRRLAFLLGVLAPAALGLGAAASRAWGQGAPAAGVVMMQPIPDNPAYADMPIPDARPSSLHVLSASDHALFLRAFALAAKGDWPGALALGAQGQNTVARQLLQWRYALDRSSNASFAEIDAVMQQAAAWPLQGTLAARAEAAIQSDVASAGLTPQQIVTWFAGREPNSSIGRIRLGEALIATGQIAKGAPLIARGWAEGSFDDATEAAILAQDGAYLTPASDRARLDALLWRNEVSAARRQMARVDAQTAALAQARLALSGGLAAARMALAKVAGSTDPTLLYDWARALRADHQDDAAHKMLLRVTPTALARDHTARWWAEVSIEARDALRAGDPGTALALVAHAGLPVGDQYPDQQFLGGFLELRFLKNPAAALPWFQRLGANVSRPISVSRAEYWQGRALEAAGDTAGAYGHYRRAAAYSETFYGQLAQARTEAAPVLHLNDSAIAAAPASEVDGDLLMPQMRVLADLGRAGDLRLFATADAETHAAPRHLKELLQMLTAWGYPEIAVRLAKAASYTGTTMLDFTHPVLVLPAYSGPGTAPEQAVVLGLIRQETEFNAYAVSSAGARGLMQMMPASARKAAQAGGLSYRPDALMADTDYNIQLGMIEFSGHVASWGGSLVLAAAGYNAGDGNARQWVASFGDPRQGGVDPVDFIEQIPFGETRNYVERVLENTEVYRNRLAGRDMPLRILADLYAPQPPPVAILRGPAGN